MKTHRFYVENICFEVRSSAEVCYLKCYAAVPAGENPPVCPEMFWSQKKSATLIPAVVYSTRHRTFSFALRSASCFMLASLSPRTTFSAKASARLQIEDTTLRACLPLARPWILAAAKSNPCSASAVWCQADRVIMRAWDILSRTPSAGLDCKRFLLRLAAETGKRLRRGATSIYRQNGFPSAWGSPPTQ